MSYSKDVVRPALLYEFLLGHTVADAHRNLVQAFGDSAPSKSQCYVWFDRFRDGDHSLDDRPRSGRPSHFNSNQLLELVEADPYQTTRTLAQTLGCDHSTVDRYLRLLGKVPKLGQWVPHELTPSNLSMRVRVCTELLSRSRRFDWLENVVTGDEKWCLYVNHTRKRQWVDADKRPNPEPKGNLHPKKEMLCVWWGVRGVYYWELLPSGTTISADTYSTQLEKLDQKLQQLNPSLAKVYFHHDNARPHIAKTTVNQILRLGWELLPHPPYSPDLAPSDFHLFRKLSLFLAEKKFDDREHLETALGTFFESQPPEFWRNGIQSLPKRWQEVIDNNGSYIID